MEDSRSPKRQRKQRAPAATAAARLPVAIVDDHHDALPQLHRFIRRKRLAFANATMIHIDAHPDLMVPPSMPAAAIFAPRRLYDALEESSGGIAEWILPLIFAGHVSRVVWIRPAWIDVERRVEIEDGEHCFVVGEVKRGGVLRVSPATPSLGPYFVDEQLCAPAEAMVRETTQSLSLLVHALPHPDPLASVSSAGGGTSSASSSACTAASTAGTSSASMSSTSSSSASTAASTTTTFTSSNNDLILDICLDYFCCANPFARSWSARFGDASLRTLRSFFFPNEQRHRTHDDLVARRALLQRGIDLVFGASSGDGDDGGGGDAGHSGGGARDAPPLWRTASSATVFCEALSFLVPLYASTDAACVALSALHALLTSPLSPSRTETAETRALAAVEAGPMLTLPDRICTPVEVDAAIALLREHLTPLVATKRFGAATIAASTVDGYVTKSRARQILCKVLCMLRCLFSGDGDSNGGSGSGGGLDLCYGDGCEFLRDL